jgi:hypothetical protein
MGEPPGFSRRCELLNRAKCTSGRTTERHKEVRD